VPTHALRVALDAFSNAEEIVWVQEEPENMGVWEFIRSYLVEVANGLTVRRVARPRSASPAEGSASHHGLNQQALVAQAFGTRAPAKPSAAPRDKKTAQLTS
jgi:2-oxoglutarate dehydrogenase complex dehydrogenase (E1) component-like enzyme